MPAARPLIGVLCCNEVAGRPIQAVASRFVAPLSALSRASVMLVPALAGINDAPAIARLLDGLMLTGSRSHVAPHRYGGDPETTPLDEERDEVAMSLAGAMIEAGKPVFGICRGLQEINVLFGGSLAPALPGRRHRRGSWNAHDTLFAHRHDVMLSDGGLIARAIGQPRVSVVSAHDQGIERLGRGLRVEAHAADDGLIEAVAARPCGADVLAVQWHPEWDVAQSPASRAFFHLIGSSLRGDAVSPPQELT